MKLPKPVKFEWDKGNVDKNWKYHNVHFKEAEEIFFNKPLRIFHDTKHSQDEERFTALGITDNSRQLYITFTVRERMIRVISARNQNSKERKVYEKK